MNLHRFNHDGEVKCGGCNYRVTTTYWMADTREEAEEKIKDKEGKDRGLCGDCMAELLSDSGHEIIRTNSMPETMEEAEAKALEYLGYAIDKFQDADQNDLAKVLETVIREKEGWV